MRASPAAFLDTLGAFQRAAAMRTALELDVFSAIADGRGTAEALANACGATERGVRIVCDYLVALGFLTKDGCCYGLTDSSRTFLTRQSRAFIGDAHVFLASPMMVAQLNDLTAVVRGRHFDARHDATAPSHAAWVQFARGMRPLMLPVADRLARVLSEHARMSAPACKVLDVGAGHGAFGIAIARRHPTAIIVALDWPAVLDLAREHAHAAGVAARYQLLPGDAFTVDPGGDYDVVVIANFLHHFDVDGCLAVLNRAARALKNGGLVMVLEFVADENRTSPPAAAEFAVRMLATTPAGAVYTAEEYEGLLQRAGFGDVRWFDAPPTDQRLLLATRMPR